MKNVSLAELIREASDEDRAALREALTATPPPPVRQALPAEALRELRARHEAAVKRVTEGRARLGRELEAAEAARAKAAADVARLHMTLAELDWQTGAELDLVRAEAFAGRLLEVDEAVAGLRAEVAGLEVETTKGPGRFSPSVKEVFSNRESVEARGVALRGLADLVMLRASQAAFATAEDLAAFVTAERAKLPAVKRAADVRRGIEADRERGAA